MKIINWKEEALHSNYRELNSEAVDKEKSGEWIRKGSIFPETEGFMSTIQDQVVPINSYKKVLSKQEKFINRYRRDVQK